MARLAQRVDWEELPSAWGVQGLPVEVLRIRRERGNAVAGLLGQVRETLDELSVEDVFAQRLSSESLDEGEQALLLGLYQQVVSELREGEA